MTNDRVSLPTIQYVASSDGVSVPFWRTGSGPPLMILNTWNISHIEAEWAMPEARDAYLQLAQRFTVIRADLRNSGLATRGVERFDLDALVDDLGAVIEAIGEPVFLVGMHHSGKVAVRYAARIPERVRRRLLFEAPIGEIFSGPEFRGIRYLVPLIEENWPLYNRLVVAAFFGLEDAQRARDFAAFSESLYADDPGEYRRGTQEMARAEIQGDLPHLQCPVRILHQPGLAEIDRAREVARIRPGTSISVLDIDETIPFFPALAIPHVEEFFGEEAAGGPASEGDSPASSFRTLLFTDLSASTATTQRLGDAAAHDLVRAHNEIVRAALAAHGGHEIKPTGDGIMAWFPAVSNGLDCSQAIQGAVDGLGNPDLGIKIGLNAGEPIAEEDDLYGTAVQIAARVTDQAAADEILCTNVVRELVAGKEYLFAERDPAALKGVEEPVRLFELRWA